jgi:hypothetical protein
VSPAYYPAEETTFAVESGGIAWLNRMIESQVVGTELTGYAFTAGGEVAGRGIAVVDEENRARAGRYNDFFSGWSNYDAVCKGDTCGDSSEDRFRDGEVDEGDPAERESSDRFLPV